LKPRGNKESAGSGIENGIASVCENECEWTNGGVRGGSPMVEESRIEGKT
jgi:hypothetical protein